MATAIVHTQSKPTPRLVSSSVLVQLKHSQRTALNQVAPDTVPPGIYQVLHSPGQPLDVTTRAFMEPRFGHDFSHVRVHTDSNASQSADAVNAVAYTTGQHIVFNRDQYAPATQQGRHVLAHELAHTLQHASGVAGSIQRIPKDPQDTPFKGEVIPWSAALRASPSRSGKVLADLPRGQSVSVLGGRWWIRVETVVEGIKLTGYVSHELIRKLPGQKTHEETAAEEAAEKSANAITNPKKEALEKTAELEPDAGIPGGKDAGPEELEPDKFTYSSELNPELRKRFNRMVIALEKQKIKYRDIDGIRPRKRAHILSTAYHIREKEAVSLKDLQALKDGKDLDGNIWYKKEWEQASTLFGFGKPQVATDEEILNQAKANALNLARNEGGGYIKSGKINCAYEGYETGDPKRQPNIPEVPISNHVTGHAIDLSGVEWSKLGGEWSEEANKFVASFGLTRPYSPEANTYCIKENWHFELAP